MEPEKKFNLSVFTASTNNNFTVSKNIVLSEFLEIMNHDHYTLI